MESIFEPSSFLDPTSYDSPSFLSFSSFADLTTSPHSISDSWDAPNVAVADPAFSSLYSPCSSSNSSPSFAPVASFSAPSTSFASAFAAKHPGPKPRTANSASSDCSSPELDFDFDFDCFEVGSTAFEVPSSAGIGIFHKAGPSKLSAADVNPGLTYSHRVSSSTDSTWDSPLITPALNEPGFSPAGVNVDLSQGAFSWDDAPTTLASSSSSYTPPTTAITAAPHRIASNPSLSAAPKNPRGLKQISSMPALKEEVDVFQWFTGDSSIVEDSENVTDEALVDNFDWVFGDYGLGDAPLEDTIFSAFHEAKGGEIGGATAPATAPATTGAVTDLPTPTAPPATSTSAPLPSQPIFPSLQASTSPTEVSPTDSQTPHFATTIIPNTTSSISELSTWYPTNNDVELAQVAQPHRTSSVPLGSQSAQSYDYTQTTYATIDPLVLSGNASAAATSSSASAASASVSRPASAPKVEGAEGLGLSSVPMSGHMSRNLTAPGFVPTRSAPPANLFSYDPQPLYPSPYDSLQPQTHVQVQTQAYISAPPPPSFPPAQVLPVRSLAHRRASTHGLSVSVHHPTYSTFTQPADLPPTPQSAPFTSVSLTHAQAQAHAQSSYAPHLQQVHAHLQAPVPMMRAGTQPLPATRRMSLAPSVPGPSQAAPPAKASGSTMPAHLIRAQAIVQMQEAKEEQQRKELRRQAASRRVNMAQASVMQPLNPAPVQMQSMALAMQPRAQPQPAIVGWDGPSSMPLPSNMPSAMQPMSIQQPPQIVHPPPSYYTATTVPQQHQQHPALAAPPHLPHLPHRVHPPPHSVAGPSSIPLAAAGEYGGSSARPMARLPSPKNAAIRKVTSPNKRSPSGAKGRRAAMQPGGFSWGEATFINFTPDDAEKLLTGVAPSGSQAKRKREEDAARMAAGSLGMGMMGGIGAGAGELLAFDMDREGSKRSRTGD